MRLQDPTAAGTPAAACRPSGSEAQQTLLTAAWGSFGQSNSGGGLAALVQALRGAVSAGLSVGKDVAGKLAQSLDGGLQKAEQTLVSQGMDPKQAAHRVTAFRRELARAVHVAAVEAATPQPATVPSTPTAVPSTPMVPSTVTQLGPASASQVSTGSAVGTSAGAATGAAVTTSPIAGTGSVATTGSVAAGALGVAGAVSMRESLQIVTADGARVSIRFAEQDLIAAGSDGSGNSLAALLSRGRIQIAVQGTLSAGDLQAVNALVAQVDGLAQQFFSGDVQDAFNSAATLGADPTEIAQFSLHLSYTRIVAGSAAATVAAPAAGSTAAPDATPATDATSSGGSASAADAASAAAPTSPADAAPAGTSSAAAAPSGQSQSASGSAQQTIGSFIQDVLGKLGSVTGTERLHFSMKWKLELLAAALPAYAPWAPGAAPAAGTQLASSTLRSLSG